MREGALAAVAPVPGSARSSAGLSEIFRRFSAAARAPVSLS
jgi:hypothetical protein